MLYLPTGTFVPNVPPRETGEKTNRQKIHAKFTPKPPRFTDGPNRYLCQFRDKGENEFVTVWLYDDYNEAADYVKRVMNDLDYVAEARVFDTDRQETFCHLKPPCVEGPTGVEGPPGCDPDPEFESDYSPCIDCGRPALGAGPFCAECILADTTPLPPAKAPITAISFVPLPHLEFNITITRKGRPAKHYKSASFQSACRVVDLVKWHKSNGRVSDFVPTLAGWVAIFAEVK